MAALERILIETVYTTTPQQRTNVTRQDVFTIKTRLGMTQSPEVARSRVFLLPTSGDDSQA